MLVLLIQGRLSSQSRWPYGMAGPTTPGARAPPLFCQLLIFFYYFTQILVLCIVFLLV